MAFKRAILTFIFTDGSTYTHTRDLATNNTFQLDYPYCDTTIQQFSICWEGIKSKFAIPISIYAWNETSSNMLIDMAGGDMYGPLTFQPNTLKLTETKDGKIIHPTIEDKIKELNTTITNLQAQIDALKAQ